MKNNYRSVIAIFSEFCTIWSKPAAPGLTYLILYDLLPIIWDSKADDPLEWLWKFFVKINWLGVALLNSKIINEIFIEKMERNFSAFKLWSTIIFLLKMLKYFNAYHNKNNLVKTCKSDNINGLNFLQRMIFNTFGGLFLSLPFCLCGRKTILIVNWNCVGIGIDRRRMKSLKAKISRRISSGNGWKINSCFRGKRNFRLYNQAIFVIILLWKIFFAFKNV